MMKWATPQEFEAFCKEIEQKIYLGNTIFLKNDIEMQKIIPLCEALQKNRTIFRIEFQSAIDDKKIAIFANELQKNIYIRELYFTNAHISSLGATALSEILKKNNLLSLVLTQESTIDTEGIKIFATLLPNIHPFLSTLIAIAIEKEDIDLLKNLKTLGVNFNNANPKKGTPLHQAVRKNNPALVKLFCEAGADVNSKKSGNSDIDTTNLTPWELMDCLIPLRKNIPTIARLLIKYGTKAKPEELIPISDNEILKNYEILLRFIRDQYKKSVCEKKKFIILISEDHCRKHSLLIEIMILKIAHDLGIENLLQEWKEEFFDDFIKNKIGSKNQASDFLTFHHIYPLSQTFNIKTYPIDTRNLAPAIGETTNKARERYMTAKTESLPIESGVMIIGALHVKAILNGLASNHSFHIAPVNSAHPNIPDYDTYYLTSPEILQIKFSGNAELWEPEEILEHVNRICKTERSIPNQFLWEAWKRNYNKKNPDAEKNGYGPGALLSISPK